MGGFYMKVSLRKIVSFVLCISMLFAFNCSVLAGGSINDIPSTQITNQYFVEQLEKITTDTFNKYPGYKETIDKVKTMLKDGYTHEQIRNTFTKSDLEILKDIGLNEKREAKNLLQSSYRQQNQVDLLAQEYYDYYKKHGEFPKVNENTNISDGLHATAVAYDSVLSGMGYYFTSEQVAAQLAELGIVSQFDGPLPYLDLICIVAGAVVLTSFAYNYYLHGDKVNGKIDGWYGSTVKAYTAQSKASTADYAWYRYWGNIKYWEASLANYRGMGGVSIIRPITDAGAVTRLASGLDIYAYFSSEACSAAALASPTGQVTREPGHTDRGMILNLPHWHRMGNGVRLPGHSFFTF